MEGGVLGSREMVTKTGLSTTLPPNHIARTAAIHASYDYISFTSGWIRARASCRRPGPTEPEVTCCKNSKKLRPITESSVSTQHTAPALCEPQTPP